MAPCEPFAEPGLGHALQFIYFGGLQPHWTHSLSENNQEKIFQTFGEHTWIKTTKPNVSVRSSNGEEKKTENHYIIDALA